LFNFVRRLFNPHYRQFTFDRSKFMRILSTAFFLISSLSLWAQPSNDDCFGSIFIPSIDDYCSADLEFTNADATLDSGLPESNTSVGCFNDHINGVWFSFAPTQTAAVFNVFAEATTNDIVRTNLNVYTGPCNNLQFVSCSRGASDDDELLISGLTPGQNYYLLVESEMAEIIFTLCINEFNAPRSPESDCPAFQVASLFTAGNNPNELDRFTDACLSSEFNSSWYKWTCDEPGSLTFTLTPNDFRPGEESDDIDFALFELPNGIDDCASMQMIRCMASGENVGESFAQWQVCNGPTGLSAGDPDTEEAAGCQSGNNNFVDQIFMEAGKSYALVVMNFSNSGLGFGIEWGGTGTFLGPVPEFDLNAIVAFECDKRLEIINSSTSETDPIVNYFWNFGNGAQPQTSTDENPDFIIYESFGEKSIALTVETSRGCLVTEILQIPIAACCADTSTLDIIENSEDIECWGFADGLAFAQGTGGAPNYNYSIDGGPFSPTNQFGDLGPGTYTLTVQDIKGCEEEATVTIVEPDPIIVETSPDITVDLGFDGTISASYFPMGPNDVVTWSPPDGLSNPEGLETTVIPPGTTTYTFTVTDENGCMGTGQVTVEANVVRPLYFPNVITPNTNDVNSRFNIGVGRQVSLIEELAVYDRWGNLIYLCNNIPPNDPSLGWDGRFGECTSTTRGTLVDPGVYVWKANILFIDDVSLPYAGTVTVLN